MSWLFSRALVEEYSAGDCSDGEPCAPLSVMPTQHKFWRNDKTMEPLTLSRFGLTCAVLTADHGEALLMSFQAGSPARTSAQPAKAQDSQALDPGSGEKWHGSWTRFDPDSCLWKTAQFSLLGDLASLGFDAQWRVLSAASVGAPHERERIWILAYPMHAERRPSEQGGRHSDQGKPAGRAEGADQFGERCEVLADAESERRGEARGLRRDEQAQRGSGRGEGMGHANDARSQGFGRLLERAGKRTPWEDGEIVVGHDGQARLVEPGIPPLADGVAHRVDRIRASGNGQVPLVAATAWRVLTANVGAKLETTAAPK